MKKLIIFFLTLILFFSCSFFHPLKEDNYTQTYSLPGTIPINDTLFCDYNKISNIDWLEYANWIINVYGEDSPECKRCIPISFNSADFGPCYINFFPEFWRYPALKELPVIGISQEQARQYSKWRSDRVFEHLLIELGKLRYNPNQTPDDCFTIERYYNGALDSLVIGGKLAYYPCYSLPTIEDRKVILKVSDSLYQKNYRYFDIKSYSDFQLKHPHVWCDINPCQNDTFYVPMIYNLNLQSWRPLLFHIRGNVAEWLDNDYYIAGGSWKDTYQSIMEKDTVFCDLPNNYTGFRNVCRWKKWNP
ncbi:MAG: gliding motility-associated lipoprotein GldJ [Bacteroidetes bacterium]|nr:gliding motility-associated lipoprotein GldJ [Bacteroidota bacterium]